MDLILQTKINNFFKFFIFPLSIMFILSYLIYIYILKLEYLNIFQYIISTIILIPIYILWILLSWIGKENFEPIRLFFDNLNQYILPQNFWSISYLKISSIINMLMILFILTFYLEKIKSTNSIFLKTVHYNKRNNIITLDNNIPTKLFKKKWVFFNLIMFFLILCLIFILAITFIYFKIKNI